MWMCPECFCDEIKLSHNIHAHIRIVRVDFFKIFSTSHSHRDGALTITTPTPEHPGKVACIRENIIRNKLMPGHLSPRSAHESNQDDMFAQKLLSHTWFLLKNKIITCNRCPSRPRV